MGRAVTETHLPVGDALIRWLRPGGLRLCRLALAIVATIAAAASTADSGAVPASATLASTANAAPAAVASTADSSAAPGGAVGASTALAGTGNRSAARQREARTWTVCPAVATKSDCDFKGDQAIADAVARATDGDVIRIRAGRYTPTAYQDVPFRELVVRAFVVIDGKDIALVGEQGVVLAGNDKLPTSAIVVRNADVSISHMEITGFRYEIEEDKIYDGHGIFVIDSKARIDDVTISKFQKMGLTGRGDTQLDASNLRVLDGHVGVWLHENAYLRLRNALVRGNDSSAIAAYDNSAAHISGSTVEGNARYGLYANQQAAVFVSTTRIAGNKLGDVNALADSRVRQEPAN